MMEASTEKNFVCDTCDKRFSQKQTLKVHQRIHTGELKYNCEYCKTGFTDRAGYYRHLRTHTGEKPFKCKHCDKAFRNNVGRRAHEERHSVEKLYKCRVCEKPFVNLQDTRVHEIQHITLIVCVHCDKAFKKHYLYRKHVATKHEGPKPHQCTQCEKSFFLKIDLEEHMRTHTGERPYVCEECTKSFKVKSSFRRHCLIHTGKKNFSCKHCGKAFYYNSSLKKHERLCQPDKPERPYACGRCGQRFSEHAPCRRHEFLSCPNLKCARAKSYICEHCNYATTTNSYLKIHIKNVHRQVSCIKVNPGCWKNFKGKGKLEKHVKICAENREQTAEQFNTTINKDVVESN